MRYAMIHHSTAYAHKRKKKGLSIHVGIYDTKTNEYIATAYGVDRAALIVDALNKQESEAAK